MSKCELRKKEPVMGLGLVAGKSSKAHSHEQSISPLVGSSSKNVSPIEAPTIKTLTNGLGVFCIHFVYLVTLFYSNNIFYL